jgi:peptidyl-prolyl cis-trans isomerase SurA
MSPLESSAHKAFSVTPHRPVFVLIAALAAGLAVAAAPGAFAQRAAPAPAQQHFDEGSEGQVERIAAVVNDDVVSVYDINNRLNLVLATSGMPNSPEVQERLRPQVMRTLIDERLELQEAKRINALATDADVQAAIGRIESANHMPPGSLVPALTREGISVDSLNQQIKAGLSWQKVVERQLRPSLGVGDDEIDEVLDRIKAEKGTTEYLLADMIEQMHRGTAFSAVAQQFSQAASASQGGDIGWVERGQLDPEVQKAVDEMDINHATMPIRTPTGYYIYLLRDKRTLAAANPEDATVTLAQLVLPLEAGATADDIKSQKELAETVRQDVKGCDDLKHAAGELHVEYADPTPDLKIRDLNPAIRPAVLNLKVGEASEPLQSDTGITLVMVCERQDPPDQMPSRDQIADNLTRQRLDLIARRYLSDLRRQAFIDVRV